MRVYIAGGMRGKPLYGFPEFDAAAEKLRAEGYKVINPADLDREAGFCPTTLPDDWDWSTYPPGTDASEFVERDLDALATCDAIYMLPRWEESQGATAEHAVAKWRGLTVFYPEKEEVSKAEKRKQMPIARGCLDYFPNALLAVSNCSWIANEQHNPGEEMHWAKEKSTDHADCLIRHLIDRGTVDTDGIPHTVKVAWRALALLETELETRND